MGVSLKKNHACIFFSGGNLQRFEVTLITLSPPVATYRFYSVLRQTILLVKGRPLVVKGLSRVVVYICMHA